MRIFKPLAALALSLVFLGCLNLAITYALEPYGSKSELAWTDYARESDIDTVIVGTSLVQNAVNPAVLDELYGCKSFSLATPSQTLEESFIAIQTAYEDHGIKRAILGVSSVAVQDGEPPSLGSAFLHHRSRVVSPIQDARAVWQVLARYGGAGQSGSINALFPWFYNHVSITPSGIGENVQARLGKTVYEAAAVTDPYGTYEGKGHTVYDTVLDYDSEQAIPFFSDEGEGDTVEAGIDADRVRTLADISAYCNEKGIDLVALSTPLPAFDVVDGDGYYELHRTISDAFSELGQHYYDFNFARPALFESQSDYFLDTQHMNEAGARAFTESFAGFLAKLDAGEGVDDLFCDDEEQRASVDYISTVFANASVDDGRVHVVARAATGSGVDVEYQLCARVEDGAGWDVAKEWSSSSSFDYTPASTGVVELRVNARMVGSRADFDRYRIVRVYC